MEKQVEKTQEQPKPEAQKSEPQYRNYNYRRANGEQVSIAVQVYKPKKVDGWDV